MLCNTVVHTEIHGSFTGSKVPHEEASEPMLTKPDAL